MKVKSWPVARFVQLPQGLRYPPAEPLKLWRGGENYMSGHVCV
jgi:hypothetical protein